MISKKTEIYRTDQKLMYQYEYLTYPVAAGVIGATRYGGLYGGVIGATLGFVDMTAMYCKLYTKPYLTSGVLGSVILSPLELPYYSAEIIGFTVGGLFPTGILNENIDSIMLLLSGALAGYSYGKVYNFEHYGAAVGFTAGIVDLGLSYYNATESYYLTLYIKHVAIANTLIPLGISSAKMAISRVFLNNEGGILNKINSEVIFRFAHVFAALTAVYSNSKFGKKEKHRILQLSNNIYELYKDIIPEKYLDDLFARQSISLIANELVFITLTLAVDKHKNRIYSSITNLGAKGDWEGFRNAFEPAFFFIMPLIGGFVFRGYLNEYFQTRIKYEVQNYFYSKITEDEVALYLTKNSSANATNANVLIKNMRNDLTLLLADGSALLADGVSTFVSGFYAAAYLYAHNIDAILYAFVYYKGTGSLTSYIAITENHHFKEIKDIQSSIERVIEYIMRNADSMVQQNKNNFLDSKLFNMQARLNYIESIQSSWNTLIKIWYPLLNIVDYFVNYFITGNEIRIHPELKDKIWAVVSFMTKVSKMLGWESVNAGKLIVLEQSTLRLTELKARMKQADEEANIHKPNYSHYKSNINSICLNNLTIGIENESRFYIDHLCVENRIVAITGASGGGKSTFLKILKGMKHSNAWGEGEISYYLKDNKVPKILMASQNDALIPSVTLLELITLKDPAEAKIHEDSVIELLKEISIDSVCDNCRTRNLISRLNEVAEWETILSGGQKQKILVVSIILQATLLGQPNFIIFDEIFKGMDPASVKIVQAMILDHIPDAQLFVVDHNILSNNYKQPCMEYLDAKSFYDCELDFINNTIISHCMPKAQENWTMNHYEALLNGECIEN